MQARALVALLPEQIGKREIGVIRDRLGLDRADCRVEDVSTSFGPGNVVMIAIEGRVVTEIITGFGVKGIGAETVASAACDEAERYLRADVAVGQHLADQLLVPMAVAGGGSFRTLEPTPHTRTNADVIRRFLDTPIAIEAEASDVYRVIVGDRM